MYSPTIVIRIVDLAVGLQEENTLNKNLSIFKPFVLTNIDQNKNENLLTLFTAFFIFGVLSHSPDPQIFLCCS
jgi:hypothetical protein